MICKKCNETIKEGSDCCPNCGFKPGNTFEEIKKKYTVIKIDESDTAVEESSEMAEFAPKENKKNRSNHSNWVKVKAAVLVATLTIGIFTGTSAFGKTDDSTETEIKKANMEVYDNTETTDLHDSKEDWLFPSDTQLLTEKYLKTKSKYIIDLIMNEIYARHGYSFDVENLHDYFSQKDWYTPTETDKDKVYEEFNETEKKNIEIITEFKESAKKADESSSADGSFVNLIYSGDRVIGAKIRLYGSYYKINKTDGVTVKIKNGCDAATYLGVLWTEDLYDCVYDLKEGSFETDEEQNMYGFTEETGEIHYNDLQESESLTFTQTQMCDYTFFDDYSEIIIYFPSNSANCYMQIDINIAYGTLISQDGEESMQLSAQF